jgi:4-hydroxy-4-methyl-2-oxoglutarate aldolase
MRSRPPSHRQTTFANDGVVGGESTVSGIDVKALDRTVLDELQSFSAPSLSNGIETFDLRPRNEGFADGTVRCMFPDLGARIGYASTATMRGAAEGDRLPPSALWEHVVELPEPRFVVVQDLDDPPGVGCYWGEVNGSIFTALGCVAVVTNGAVRDLSEMRAIGLQAFAGSVAVSHAYNHLVGVGEPVTVGGLVVRPGDLLHGDQHGVLSIPFGIAEALAAATRAVEAEERELIDFCRSPDFSPEALTARARLTTSASEGDLRH